MNNLNDLTKDELIEVVQSTHKKIKRVEQANKKLRKQLRVLHTVREVLSGISFYFDKYDVVTDLELGKLQGRVELKEELLEIIKKPH